MIDLNVLSSLLYVLSNGATIGPIELKSTAKENSCAVSRYRRHLRQPKWLGHPTAKKPDIRHNVEGQFKWMVSGTSSNPNGRVGNL